MRAMYRLALLTLLVCGIAPATDLAENFFTNVRQLTHGGENAEAYWSPDGKRLIFQSTRSPYECDQIFIMNADGSNPHAVTDTLWEEAMPLYLPND